ncbi:MAG: acyltransferase [Pseudomonadota bacterium]
MENKLYKLEALRGFAALYVVIHHSLPHTMMFAGINFAYLIRFGQEAVILFFLVSGFVIHYSFSQGSDKSFRSYFLKRFTRIYIPLLLVFLLSFLIISFEQNAFVHLSWRELLGNLFMLQDWVDAKPYVIVNGFLGNDPLWSLSYEWWFYMAFYPLAVYVKDATRRDNIVFGIAILASLLYLVYPHFFVRLPMYMAIWWVGVNLSQLYILKDLRLANVRKPLSVLGIVAGVLTANAALQASAGKDVTFGFHPVLELRHFGFAICAVIFAFYWRNAGWVYFDKMLKPFLVVAPISYVIYISHFHLFSEASYLSFIGNSQVEWILYFTIVLFASYLIERRIYPILRKPVMKWLGKSHLSDVYSYTAQKTQTSVESQRAVR